MLTKATVDRLLYGKNEHSSFLLFQLYCDIIDQYQLHLNNQTSVDLDLEKSTFILPAAEHSPFNYQQ